MLGGEQVDPGSSKPLERRLLNIVEEMSIASGVQVPAVYVLRDEDGINAFAAGTTRQNAIIGVTWGCMELLTRDELQGVVAHEFSHILNADTRVNIRLMGLLNGIVIIAICGYRMIRAVRGSGKGGGLIFFSGIVCLISGALGAFFANLIKAAIARQREFLADASAVQFTRNPAGICGALRKIGGLTVGSELSAAGAAEASHFFFADGVSLMSKLAAVHPPIPERIRRINPSMSGEPEPMNEQNARAQVEVELQTAAPRAISGLGTAAVPGFAIDAETIMNSVGGIASGAVVADIVAGIDSTLLDACRDPDRAAAVIYGLLFDDNPAVREKQAGLLDHAEPDLANETSRLLPAIATAGPFRRLPLLDLAMPAVRCLLSTNFGGNFLTQLLSVGLGNYFMVTIRKSDWPPVS